MNNVFEQIELLSNGLNEAQKRAVLNPVDTCTKIVAGAGTGKTKIISKRFTKLVLESGEGSENNILVITFTDKAAGEMKGRILSELAQNNINNANNGLWVSTFHSFCSRLLKKHSIEAGLSPSFKLGEEQVLQNVYDNILKRIKYGETENIADLSRICSDLGIEKDILSVKSLASLGEIKETEQVLTEIFDVIKKIKSLGLNAKEFYEKSVVSIKNFSQTITNTPFKFDSKEEYTLAWAQHYRKYTDEVPDFTPDVFDAIAKSKVILDKQGKRKASEYAMAQGFPDVVSKIEKYEIMLTKVIAVIYSLYQNELQKLDIVDFDDLINKSIEVLKNNELIRNYYQNYFKHIIIDEFQDTNGAQLELIQLLMNSQNPNLTFVGDRKQSIYGFRHAQPENLDVLYNYAEKIYSKTFEPVSLSLNYRSTADVLNAVNYVTQNELSLPEEKLEAGIEHEYVPENVVVTVLNGADDNFENAYEHKIAEAKYTANEIIRLKERDNASYKDFAILVKSHSQADLIEKFLRKNNIPAIKKVNTGYFKEPLIKNVIGLLRLVKNTIDETAFVRILKIYFSESQIYRFKSQADSLILKEKDFEELKRMNLCEKFILLSAQLPEIAQSSEVFAFSKKLYETINETRKNSETLLQTYYALINNITPYKGLSGFDRIKAHNDLMVFERIIADFMHTDGYISIHTFLEHVQKISADRSFELPVVNSADIDAVQILTIHASKGLEFPYVFMASISSASKKADKSTLIFDMQYGEKPGFGIILNKFKDKTTPKALLYKELWKNPRDVNEELRLFYVAVSRAKKYLNVLNFEPFGNNSSIKPAGYIQNLSDFLESEKPLKFN